ncbi:hypothetical protein E2R68_09665 [Psychromonas sp. RZ22]|nr:hypothetical protein E2R68_09665 [Psychromonas sp. RZ22]
MLNQSLIQTLSLFWKLLTVLILPVIMFLYIKFMDVCYEQPFTFADLDQGKNIHKWMIIAIYLAFLLCWNRLNPIVMNILKKLEH